MIDLQDCKTTELPLKSGVYFVRFQIGDETETIKILFVND